MKFKPEKRFFNTQSGGTSDPLDSFHDKYYKLAKAVRNWQIAFLSVTVLLGITIVGLIKVSTQSSITPYIVEVNKEEGIIRRIGDINRINYQVNDKLILSTLRSFLNNTRTISLDPVLYSKNISESYNFLGEVAQNKLKESIISDNVQDRMRKKETRDLSITSILKIDNKNFQVRWSENNYDDNGNVEYSRKYSGIFTVEIIKSTSEQRILLNPVGITITDFSFSREM